MLSTRPRARRINKNQRGNSLRPAKLSEDETRALILEKAYALFAEVGYNKTTVADIARACGFSAANVHKFFGTKSAINQTIAGMMMSEKLDEMRAAVERKQSAAEKLRAFILTIHKSTLESFQHRAKVYETLAAAAEEKWPVIRDYRMALLTSVRDIIAYGCERGEFEVDDVDATAQAVHMSLIRLFHPLNVVEMIGEPDAGDAETLIDFLVNTLKRR